MTDKSKQARLYEYRIKYNAGIGHAAFDNYHYYMAETAEQAFEYHLEALRRHHTQCQSLCVEQRNPWANRWEDMSETIKLNNE
jgi:hypothetical protein